MNLEEKCLVLLQYFQITQFLFDHSFKFYVLDLEDISNISKMCVKRKVHEIINLLVRKIIPNLIERVLKCNNSFIRKL